ncbi:SGNH/GDSL hydrolase family protein [Flaviaesturariibacter amylovorans]|uniref:SGNH/GDSL hydrolase family protein n=1 Tax=Flaviaesturariibacter amylovorans TaxID=1084520 RepID=A0ABP8GTV9_9BACT
MEKLYTYLALGDSYTIGEALPLPESFPYQAVQLLRKEKVHIAPPEIIARTGWTTDELAAAVNAHTFLKHYDFVSLLIGVNNQYRGRSVEEYNMECGPLVERAVALAHGKPEHVFVLSIPDWGATPFAAGRNRETITSEIDQYNTMNRALAAQYKTQYIDITPGTREALGDPSLVASDDLHPSAAEYARWAQKLAEGIRAQLK